MIEYLTFFVIKSDLIKLHLFTITSLVKAISTKILNLNHHFLKEKNATQTLYVLMHHLAPFSRPRLAKYCRFASVRQTFPKHHKYYKLFNRNNVNISYSCMQNVSSVIQFYNAYLLKDPSASSSKACSSH